MHHYTEVVGNTRLSKCEEGQDLGVCVKFKPCLIGQQLVSAIQSFQQLEVFKWGQWKPQAEVDPGLMHKSHKEKKKKKQNDNSNNTNILCLFFQAYELDFQCKLRSRAVIMPDMQIYNFELLGN